MDGFREVNPEPDQYTWWSNRGQAWAKNVGWRIDYQVLSPGLRGACSGAAIYKDERFSDHAPLSMDYDRDSQRCAPDARDPRKPWWRGRLERWPPTRSRACWRCSCSASPPGLPFPLVFTTLTAWLREVGIERARSACWPGPASSTR